MAPAFRRRRNWVQLFRFGIVGVSGFVVSLTAYTVLLKQAGSLYIAAATGLGKVVAQARAIIVVTQLSSVGNEAWSSRR